MRLFTASILAFQLFSVAAFSAELPPMPPGFTNRVESRVPSVESKKPSRSSHPSSASRKMPSPFPSALQKKLAPVPTPADPGWNAKGVLSI